ncbi:MAG: polyribonucleotide nucleotidyltransferase [Candidatus Daviesbacteria bacterium]|nr:MAG: polyribonucleotide nucleotidyltransferase [Candidatus Daviesbacteria bacterium]
MNKVITKEIDLNGRKLKLETGKFALQADSSVVVTLGETVALVTVATKPTVEATGHFPLSVEYVEKYYAGGRISSSKFIKRETRPSEEAILTGRLIDRSIRPLFPKDFQTEVQVIITILSIDQLNDPDIVGLIGTSAALSISSVPWHGPLGGARIGEKDGTFVVNPQQNEMEHLDLDLLVASTREKVVMIEAGGNQVTEEVMFKAIQEAHQHSQSVIDFIEEFAKEAGKEKQTYSTVAEEVEEALLAEVKKLAHEKIETALFDKEHAWHEATGDMIKEDLAAKYSEVLTPQMVSRVFDKAAKEIMNETILNKGVRVDDRAMDEVRPITAEVELLPRTHGSAMFQRGDTQVLSVVTLGAASLQQTIEGMAGEEKKRFMHHYNMSINPFSTGEVKRIGSPNRRDTGHGAMVEKALSYVIPDKENFPYAIRVVSEVLAANASTSMASLCASTLALLDAGVPLKEPVAGVALGLLSNEQKFQVITDMRAVEDFYGEMDFKVSGTKNGITAIQMDTKLEGLTFEIIQEALSQGKKAREFILGKMNEVISGVGKLSIHAPKIAILHIEQSEIGALIGPGGKNINGIISRTGAQVDVEDDGTVMVSSTSQEAIDKAVSVIEAMFKKVAVGEIYTGKVVRLAPFGAFVEIVPGKDGLVHVSQMAPGRVEKPEDIVSEGQEVKVRVTDVSPEGKIGLSMLFGADIKPESEGSPRFRSGQAGRPSGGVRRFDRRSGPPRESGRPSFSDRGRSGGFSRGPRPGGPGRARSFSRGGFGGSRGGNRGGFNR